MGIKVEATGVLFSPNPTEKAGRAVRSVFSGLGRKLVASTKARAPVDTSGFQQSINMRLSGQGLNTVLTVFANSKNAIFVEEGRKPGKAPPLRPTGQIITRGKNKGKPKLESILVDWMRRRGMRGSDYALGQKIAKRGIKGHYIFRDLAIDNATDIYAASVEMGQGIVTSFNS